MSTLHSNFTLVELNGVLLILTMPSSHGMNLMDSSPSEVEWKVIPESSGPYIGPFCF